MRLFRDLGFADLFSKLLHSKQIFSLHRLDTIGSDDCVYRYLTDNIVHVFLNGTKYIGRQDLV